MAADPGEMEQKGDEMQMPKNGRLGEGIAWRAPARRQLRQVGPPCYRFPAAGLTVFPFLVNSLHLSRSEEPGRTAATLKTLVPREQVEVRRRRTTGRVLLAASESGPHRMQGKQDGMRLCSSSFPKVWVGSTSHRLETLTLLPEAGMEISGSERGHHKVMATHRSGLAHFLDS